MTGATKISSFIDEHSSDAGIAKKIASFLIETKQTLSLDSVMRDVMTTREKSGTYEINVVSAHVLGAEQKKKIETFMKQQFPLCKQIIMNEKVEPGLLGGVRIESANFLIDRSVKSKLNYLKSNLDK